MILSQILQALADVTADAAKDSDLADIDARLLGAALRHATRLLDKQPQAMRLLLLLSDGKPHDIDLYEGRYGIEDTRVALIEARERGIRPFCVTIDREGASYLPHLFGPGGYTVLRRPDELPARLPVLYAQLTS